MGIFKLTILSSLAVTFIFAKVDFVNFSDICQKTSTQSCKNNPLEIKAIQYLLKKKINPNIEINGVLDKPTKDAIIALQLKENIPASGYIGRNTKDALNKLLYGHRLHDKKIASKEETKEIKKEDTKSQKVEKVASKKVEKKAKIAKKTIEPKKEQKVKIASKKPKTKVVKNEAPKSTKLVKKSSKAKVAKVAKNDKKQLKVAKKNLKKVKLAKKESSKVTKKIDKKVTKHTKVALNKKGKFKSYEEFVRSVDLRKSYAVYQDPKLLKKAGGRNTLLKVDISEQRVKLVVDGKIALDAPCTTGSKHKLEPNTRTYRDKRTPLGTFKVMEKIATKRSNIFGDIYKNGKLIYHGDRRKYKGSWKGVKFVGAPLKNWMRLTSSGIGLHASTHVKRYPGSNGCIRLLPTVANTLFKKVKPGTTVKVVN